MFGVCAHVNGSPVFRSSLTYRSLWLKLLAGTAVHFVRWREIHAQTHFQFRTEVSIRSAENGFDEQRVRVRD